MFRTTACLATTYHPVLERGAIAACAPLSGSQIGWQGPRLVCRLRLGCRAKRGTPNYEEISVGVDYNRWLGGKESEVVRRLIRTGSQGENVTRARL